MDHKKDVIITGGFNVFASEVEKVVASFDAVEDCAVIGVPDDAWGEAVKAIVELAPGRLVSAAEIITRCKQRLGRVKAPKSVEFIVSLPRSARGKVLQRVLREKYWQGLPTTYKGHKDCQYYWKSIFHFGSAFRTNTKEF